jgi:hypothetical protein
MVALINVSDFKSHGKKENQRNSPLILHCTQTFTGCPEHAILKGTFLMGIIHLVGSYPITCSMSKGVLSGRCPRSIKIYRITSSVRGGCQGMNFLDKNGKLP